MTEDAAITFAYHLFIGFTVALTLSFFWARQVATQAQQVKNYTGDVVTTFRVDRQEFLRTWALFTFGGTAVWLVILVLWETRKGLQAMGIIG